MDRNGGGGGGGTWNVFSRDAITVFINSERKCLNVESLIEPSRNCVTIIRPNARLLACQPREAGQQSVGGRGGQIKETEVETLRYRAFGYRELNAL